LALVNLDIYFWEPKTKVMFTSTYNSMIKIQTLNRNNYRVTQTLSEWGF